MSNKTFEQWLSENRNRYPTVWKKLQRDKERVRWSKLQVNKKILWDHGIRSKGPPTW